MDVWISFTAAAVVLHVSAPYRLYCGVEDPEFDADGEQSLELLMKKRGGNFWEGGPESRD